MAHYTKSGTSEKVDLRIIFKKRA